MKERASVSRQRAALRTRIWVSATLILSIWIMFSGQTVLANQPPTIIARPDTSINQLQGLTFTVRALDVESTPTLSASGLPTGALFTPQLDGSGTFNWLFLTVTTVGIYRVTFIATDDSAAADTITVRIFVLSTTANDPPFLDTSGAQNGLEGNLLTFSVYSFDGEGAPTLSVDSMPVGAGFVDHHDGTGQFSWTPSYTQSGNYQVRVKATDDSGVVASELVPITIAEAGNQTPVLAAIGNKTTTENVLLSFTVSATDPEGSTPLFSTSTLPSGASFIDNNNGTGSFSWTPSFVQFGTYQVRFRASDGQAIDSEVITITVNEAGNQPPVLAAIGGKSVTEGNLLSFSISATDPDGTTPAFSTSTLPTGASFVDSGNGKGSFSWTPGFTQAGSYNVRFRATDGVVVDSEIVTITVNEAGNQTPVLAAIGAKSVAENALLSFSVSASDPDGTIPTFSTSALPTGAVFVDSGNGKGSFSWTPGFTQAGSYSVRFRASDGTAIDSEIVSITVNEAGNQTPVLAAIGGKAVTENASLSFSVNASDPDSTIPALNTSSLPSGASFVDSGNGKGSFSWTPNFTQAGSYPIRFRATDGIAVDSEIVTITVNEAGNQPPVLASIGSKSTTEGILLSFSISATDPDGTTPAFSTSTLPTGASFVDSGNGKGSFSWTPGFTQAGSYDIRFRATDGVIVDSEIVTIIVNEAGNQNPVLATIGAKSVAENALLSFSVSASDPDGTTPTFSTSSLPTGAVFVDSGNGKGSFNWTPGFTQAGSYSVRFRATDGTAIDSEIVSITVNEAGNQAPVLASIGNKNIGENALLSFSVSATDPDGTTPTFSTSTLPTGAVFVDSGNGKGSFTWTPNFSQAGSYPIRFRATDGVTTDSEIVTVTVTEAGNQPPILASIGNKTITEGSHLSFTISATDADGTNPALTLNGLAAGVPAGASFSDAANGSGTFSWTPGYTQSGDFTVRFQASDGFYVDSETITITVVDAGNQPPQLNTINSQTLNEGETVTLLIAASDPESFPTLDLTGLPASASFIDSGNGTGTFSWTPSYTDSGSYQLTATATDDSGEFVTQLFTITVADSSAGGGIAATFSNYPNPFSTDEHTTFPFFLDEAGKVNIEIFTLTGSRVITVADNDPRGIGPSETDTWDGKNEAGRKVVPGTYICQITVRYDSGRTESTRRKVAVQ